MKVTAIVCSPRLQLEVIVIRPLADVDIVPIVVAEVRAESTHLQEATRRRRSVELLRFSAELQLQR